MSSKIRKRSGHQVPFDMEKIYAAVDKAFEAAGKKTPATFKSIINQNSNKFKTAATVERIQDEIENLLLSCGHIDVYKKFSTYRAHRAVIREAKQSEVFKSIVNLENNDITNDNANMSATSPAGMMYKFGAESTKAFAKQYVLNPKYTKEMNNGYIHIHDLDHLAFSDFNCLQSPMDKILRDGFSAGHGSVRGAKRIETAAFLMMIALETTQNEMFGGQGIPAFDFYLAPFVRKAYEQEVDRLGEILEMVDEDIEKLKQYPITEYAVIYDNKYVNMVMERVVDRVHQSMESFIHNANQIHSRGGNQVVFSSINYGTDTSPEGRCIIREVLRACMEGVGNGSTAIFPIHIFKCKEGVNKNPGDPNYDLYKMSWAVTARRFFPNYINLDASFYKTDCWHADDPKRYIYEPATMGCRTSLFKDRFLSYPTTIGRGNLSFTTINLPMLALDAAIEDGFYVKTEDGYEITGNGNTRDRIEAFMHKLDEYCDLVAEQLHDRFEAQAKTKALQYPLVMAGLYMGSENFKSTDEVREAIKHGTLSIGFVGLAEALIALTGKHHGESEMAQKLGVRIVERIYNHCQEYSDKYDLNYSCFATPAESVAGKMEHITAARYGKIKNITDRGYFTNSNHVPVWYHCTPKHKAEIEGPYHKYTTAGHIFYVEADADLTKNPEAVDAVNRMAWANDMGYNAINHVSARCPRCSYEVHDGTDAPDRCPKCGEKMDKLARVTGYLSSTLTKWNSGKKAEFRDRVIHTK